MSVWDSTASCVGTWMGPNFDRFSALTPLSPHPSTQGDGEQQLQQLQQQQQEKQPTFSFCHSTRPHEDDDR